ncbi:MAG: hypothetical protein ACXVRK_01825 [Gaiellaceae bacterium]
MQDQQRPEPARYAVVFRIGSSRPTAGALVVDDWSLMLVGGSVDDPVEVSVAYSALREVRIGRSSEERLNGRPALLLARRDGPVIQVAPHGFGLLHELADLLAVLAIQQADGYEQVAVVVPLKPGCVERAKELVAKGPPFDPAALGLERHQIFVSEREAVFVFTGQNVREKLEQVTRNPTLWRAGLAWRACIAGAPRLTNPRAALPGHNGRPLYSWNADDTPR